MLNNFDGLTFNNAVGLLKPSFIDDSSEAKSLMNTIAVNSYKIYSAIVKKQYSYFIDGAFIMPAYFPSKKESDLKPCVAAGVMQLAKDVVLDFGNGITRKMVAYDDRILINVPKMMTSLTNYLKSRRVTFIKNKIENFAEIKAKYILNCTGLDAKELNNDNAMVPGQGHLIMLKDQNPEDVKYLISVDLDSGKTQSWQAANCYFYMHPKHLPSSGANDVGGIGGTFIKGATPQTPNEEQFELIVTRVRNFYGIGASQTTK